MENAGESAIACASARVPSAKASNSNTPTGPFQTIVPAPAMIARNASTDCGPMSRIMSSAATSLDSFQRRLRGRREFRRDDDIDRNRHLAGKFFDNGARFAHQVGLRERLADAPAGGEHEGVGDAAADDQRVDHRRQMRQDRQLGRDLGAGDDRHQRPRRACQRGAQRVELGGEQRSGAGDRSEARDAVRGRFGAVRGAEGVVDVDVAQRRHPAGERLVVLLLAVVEAAVLEQHDLAGRSASCHAPPSTQSRISGTSRPSSSPSRRATGASESAAVKLPSVGRPRCEVTITAAPRASASRMPGTDARMRVSSVIAPASSCGTLRSARMNTRLSRTSTSARRLKFIAAPSIESPSGGHRRIRRRASCREPWCLRARIRVFDTGRKHACSSHTR